MTENHDCPHRGEPDHIEIYCEKCEGPKSNYEEYREIAETLKRWGA